MAVKHIFYIFCVSKFVSSYASSPVVRGTIFTAISLPFSSAPTSNCTGCLPESLLKRADVILEELEKEGGGTMPAQRPVVQEPSPMGDSLFSSPVIDKLLGVDVSSMTPIEAISFLYSLQKDAKEGSGIH